MEFSECAPVGRRIPREARVPWEEAWFSSEELGCRLQKLAEITYSVWVGDRELIYQIQNKKLMQINFALDF